MRLLSFNAAVAVAVAVAAASAVAAPYQTTGHTDIRFLYQGGSASLAYYLDEGAIVDGQEISAANPMGGTPITLSGGQTKIAFQPSELITYIPDPPIIIPEDYAPFVAFTGAGANDPLWNIPQTQEEDRPWTGISTESVSSADFSNIRYQLTSFSGPGQMSVLFWGVFGEPNPEFTTSNGLSSDDAIDVPAHTHAHYEWYFTAPGTYTFDLTVTGTLTPAAGGGTVSASDTFTFQVIPEPASLSLLGMGVAALLLRRQAVRV